ncbi:MAG TPA: serine/threonine-protein kinase [Kofleriaceae bacterium]|nr:serine/threonine-protein kinase [Kofleriaceae bacterium]
MLKQLGAGASSIVFAAYDRQLRRGIALKLLAPGSVLQGLREAKAMASVSHPNVVKVYDTGTICDAAYLTMELVRGTTLREWAKSPRSASEIVWTMTQAGRGLAAAHAAGILHRDFKPANVLVDHHGAVKVADFGVAGAARREVTGSRTGTEPYMSPEEAMGGTVDARSDQFSFCATLYELLAGAPLFPSGTAADIPECGVELLLRRLRATVGDRLWRVLARGLAYDPDARYLSMDQLLGDLERALLLPLPADEAAIERAATAPTAIEVDPADADTVVDDTFVLDLDLGLRG